MKLVEILTRHFTSGMKCNKSDLSAAPTKLNPALIKANINDSGKDRRWAYSSNRKKNYKKLIRR